MSRRNQSRRRRSYGRRQHEVRERRTGPESADWTNDTEPREDWLASDNSDETRGYGQAFEGYLR